ncbi:peptidoglycan-binding domain-containing protein [Hyalangium minutum]|uniref:Peptidoglycan binding-like domain-containing protein n=1 Tax=Hyalangium minutum TaxID=394096 RepID=A0A085WFT0_9BACT|nr:peptidoglycan-binding domain-containing protein [Hyalangium minutum]KFE66543.1 hypothetical protein DB31_1016 [Hyalangium minutum]
MKLLQQALQQIGYGALLKKKPDGVFDDETRQAVEQFQQNQDLMSDGVVGSQTLAELDLLMSRHESSSLSEEDDDDFSFRPFVLGPLQRLGSTGSGHANVSPQVALAILDNMAKTKGQISFIPDKGGVGQCSWFTIEGDPYVGKLAGKPIKLDVALKIPDNALVFKEAELVQRIKDKAQAFDAEADYRQRKNIPKNQELSSRQKEIVRRLHRTRPEQLVWNEVGQEVQRHPSKIGIIEYDGVDRGDWSLSKNRPGKTVAVADGSKITIKGGVGAVVEALQSKGYGVDPTLREAAETLVRRAKNVAKVKGVFKYGGRVLIVVGAVADGYRIYRAENKLKETVKVAGGWAGASAAAALFSAFWVPADTAGPIAWGVHGVGVLVAGGVGYFVGSKATTYVYELVLEE